MSDSVTDRIAAILTRHHWYCTAGEPWQKGRFVCASTDCDGTYGSLTEFDAHVAEVIVEQLGLAQEWAAADKSDKGNTYGVIDGSRGGSRENAARYVYFDRLCAVSRYVSKWEAG